MPDRVITAEMVLNAKDNGAADTLAKIAGKLDAVAKAASHSDKVKELGKAFTALDGQMQALDKLNGAQKTFGAFNERATMAATRVKALESAMAAVDKPSAAMVTSLTNAHAAFDKASGAVTRQAEAVRKAESAIAAMGIPLGKTTEAQERLRREMDSTTGAIERQMIADRRAAEAAKAGAVADRERIAAQHRLHDIAHRNGVGHLVTNAAAGYVTAHSFIGLGEKAYEAGAEYQHEIVGLRNAGRTTKEIAEITEAAARVAKAVPTSTYIENLKVIAETTSAFGSVEHAMEHLQLMQKSMSVLKIAGGEHIKGGVGDVGRDFAKFFEERLTKPEDFDKEARQMIPAMVASGGTFNPHEMYMFGSQAKSSLANYDMDFLSTIVPSLVTASSGEKAGTAANAFNSIIMGKVNDRKQAEAWLAAGLLDPKKVIMKAGHAVGWSAGAVRGTDLALSNPLAWSEQVQIPHLQKNMGVDVHDRLSVAKALGTMYRNQNGNLFATEITQEASRHRLHKDADLYRKAGSLETIYDRNLNNDPLAAMTGLTSAFTNLMTAVTAEGMKPAAEGITWVAGALGHLADVAKDHPTAALAAGGATLAGGLGVSGFLTAKLLGGGFGLRGSAHALDASALALKEAAGAIAAEGHGVPGSSPGGSSKTGGFGGVFGTIGGIMTILGLSEYAKGQNVLQAPQTWDARGFFGALEPNLPDMLPAWMVGPQIDPATAERDARIRRTERQRLTRDPLESGRDRLRDDLLRPVQPAEAFGPHLPPAFHPDDDRITRARASDADAWIQQQDMIRAASQQFGQLNDKTGVLQTAFTTLDSGSGTAAQQIALLGLAARTVAGTMAGMLASGGGTRGGSGLINASWGGGAPNLSGAFRSGGASVGHLFSASEREGNIRKYAASIGINPNVAMAVARSEGFGRFDGDRGTSFGDLQMHIGGGLGDTFRRATGLNPADPKNELALDRFALDQAKRGGWAPWHGAARIGVHGRYGLDEHPALKAPPLPRRHPDHDAPAGRAVTAQLDRVTEKLERVASAVERGGLIRHELSLPDGVKAKKTYQRGSVGSTIA